jgi:hypothetical protein
MAVEQMIFPGIVKNGVVVPEGKAVLPEGAHVSILVPNSEISPELQAETQAWERASDEAWRLIDQMEKEEGFESW